MKVELPKGKYVLAVSGGVDSMTLLDILAKKPGLELIVAHFDHGIRSDSGQDEQLVRAAAKKHGLAYVSGSGQLGTKASEATARKARYAFLETVRQKNKAKAIITAHHQDDVIETTLINLVRGTGWRGLNSLRNTDKRRRPLLAINKPQILAYAKRHKLTWNEDSTNLETDKLRNYLRKQVIPKLTSEQRQNLLNKIDSVAKSRSNQEKLIATISQSILKDRTLNRRAYSSLPREVTKELLTSWLSGSQTDRQKINAIDLSLRTAQPGKSFPVNKQFRFEIKDRTAQLVSN